MTQPTRESLTHAVAHYRALADSTDSHVLRLSYLRKQFNAELELAILERNKG